jgi:hypothetical protein
MYVSLNDDPSTKARRIRVADLKLFIGVEAKPSLVKRVMNQQPQCDEPIVCVEAKPSLVKEREMNERYERDE